MSITEFTVPDTVYIRFGQFESQKSIKSRGITYFYVGSFFSYGSDIGTADLIVPS